jgi:hypothetical protein
MSCLNVESYFGHFNPIHILTEHFSEISLMLYSNLCLLVSSDLFFPWVFQVAIFMRLLLLHACQTRLTRQYRQTKLILEHRKVKDGPINNPHFILVKRKIISTFLFSLILSLIVHSVEVLCNNVNLTILTITTPVTVFITGLYCREVLRRFMCS